MAIRWALAVLCVMGLAGGAAAEDRPLLSDRSGTQQALGAMLSMDPEGQFTDAQVREALRDDSRGMSWWNHIDQPFRDQLLANKPKRWLAVIICNYQGAPPGTPYATQCEDAYIARQKRVTSQWDANGNWIDASPACLKANNRTQFGELICEAEQQKPPGS